MKSLNMCRKKSDGREAHAQAQARSPALRELRRHPARAGRTRRAALLAVFPERDEVGQREWEAVMSQQRKYQDSAARQRAYRERKRNAQAPQNTQADVTFGFMATVARAMTTEDESQDWYTPRWL